jgi:hypothetical protein
MSKQVMVPKAKFAVLALTGMPLICAGSAGAEEQTRGVPTTPTRVRFAASRASTNVKPISAASAASAREIPIRVEPRLKRERPASAPTGQRASSRFTGTA